MAYLQRVNRKHSTQQFNKGIPRRDSEQKSTSMSIYEDCQSNVHLDYAFKVDNCPLSGALAKIWSNLI